MWWEVTFSSCPSSLLFTVIVSVFHRHHHHPSQRTMWREETNARINSGSYVQKKKKSNEKQKHRCSVALRKKKKKQRKSGGIFCTATTINEIRFYTFNIIFTENKHENFSIERKFVIFLVSLRMLIFFSDDFFLSISCPSPFFRFFPFDLCLTSFLLLYLFCVFLFLFFFLSLHPFYFLFTTFSLSKYLCMSSVG